MATKGPLSMLLFSLLTAMVVKTAAEDDYEMFIQRHIDFPKSESAYCKKIMEEKDLHDRDITFIHAPEEYIKAICTKKKKPLNGVVRSAYIFPYTYCIANSENGEEFTGILDARNLLVRCHNGLPTHFYGPAKPKEGKSRG